MSEIRFGNYRVTEQLGAGSVATIYKAIQEPLGRVVALKALKTQIAATSSFGEQLDREAKILADLVHPNVVLLLDASRTTSGRPFLVLEHVDGPSVEKLRTKRKKLAVTTALAIGCGVCAALAHIHERGIVHRDIKPSNILLARGGTVRLIDFGIAQRPRTASVSDAIGAEGITPSGRIAPEQVKDAFGTPAYMSPEQILGDFVDGRSDLFSLGVVLYEVLSGTRPFDVAGEKQSAAQRTRRNAPTPLRERAPNVPRAVERIVMRLLEKAPSERYPSASAVLERLQSALRAETKDDPATLVAAAVAEGAGAPGHLRTPLKRPRFERLGGSAFLGSSLGAALGYAGIVVAFVVGVLVIERRSFALRAKPAGAEVGAEHEPSGGLRVVASPWASVRVDGVQLETTPFARAIPLAEGKHWVTLTHPDAPPIDREIDVVAGETVSLDVTMAVAEGPKTETVAAPSARRANDDAGRDAR